MIRKFEMVDLRRIKGNCFSDVRGLDHIFERDDVFKHTLIDENSNVQAVICWLEYDKDCYAAFFLIADKIPFICARELKRFVHTAIHDLGAVRVQTDSVACDVLDKWHRFLDFEFEGLRRKMVGGKDYASWAWVRG